MTLNPADKFGSADYVRAPQQWLAADKELGADLYIHLPQNGTTIRFRSKGDSLSLQDVEALKRVPAGNLLVLRSQLLSVLGSAVREIKTELTEPARINSDSVQSASRVILETMSASPSGQDVDHAKLARELLSELTLLMEDIVRTLGKSRSVFSYEAVLQRWKRNENSLAAHHRQVSALSALIQLAVGDTTEQEFSDIAMAGLVHDVGMGCVPNSLVERHILGRGEMSSSEKIIYMRHIDATQDLLKDQEVAMTPGASRIISQHHENWDGSGFRGHKLGQIYRPARILRIADALVPLVTDSASSKGLGPQLEDLSKENGPTGVPIFDPAVIARLLIDMGKKAPK